MCPVKPKFVLTFCFEQIILELRWLRSGAIHKKAIANSLDQQRADRFRRRSSNFLDNVDHITVVFLALASEAFLGSYRISIIKLFSANSQLYLCKKFHHKRVARS